MEKQNKNVNISLPQSARRTCDLRDGGCANRTRTSRSVTRAFIYACCRLRVFSRTLSFMFAMSGTGARGRRCQTGACTCATQQTNAGVRAAADGARRVSASTAACQLLDTLASENGWRQPRCHSDSLIAYGTRLGRLVGRRRGRGGTEDGGSYCFGM